MLARAVMHHTKNPPVLDEVEERASTGLALMPKAKHVKRQRGWRHSRSHSSRRSHPSDCDVKDHGEDSDFDARDRHGSQVSFGAVEAETSEEMPKRACSPFEPSRQARRRFLAEQEALKA